MITDFHIDNFGFARSLGYRPPETEDRRVRASTINIQTLRINRGLPPLIPAAEWKPVDFVTGYPTSLLCNQFQEGACVGGSCVGASQRQRYIRTGIIIPLSLWFVYDQINDGVDGGAVIRRALDVMLKTGAPPLTAYPQDSPSRWRAGWTRPGVLFYKESVAVTVSDSAEAATALQMGIFPQLPILVTGNFSTYDEFGVPWGGNVPNSRASNHSIYLVGMVKIGGVWYFIAMNSWGLWGPFGNGAFRLPFAAIDRPAVIDDGWGHAATYEPDNNAPGTQ